jgi:hypothetical protein
VRVQGHDDWRPASNAGSEERRIGRDGLEQRFEREWLER